MPLFCVIKKTPSPCIECETSIIKLKPFNKTAKNLCKFNNYFCNIEILVNKKQYHKYSLLSFKTLSDTTKFTNFIQEW